MRKNINRMNSFLEWVRDSNGMHAESWFNTLIYVSITAILLHAPRANYIPSVDTFSVPFTSASNFQSVITACSGYKHLSNYRLPFLCLDLHNFAFLLDHFLFGGLFSGRMWFIRKNAIKEPSVQVTYWISQKTFRFNFVSFFSFLWRSSVDFFFCCCCCSRHSKWNFFLVEHHHVILFLNITCYCYHLFDQRDTELCFNASDVTENIQSMQIQ